jgi:hypothetical protein
MDGWFHDILLVLLDVLLDILLVLLNILPCNNRLDWFCYGLDILLKAPNNVFMPT